MAIKAVFKDESPKKKKKVERAKDSSMKPLAKYYLDDYPDKEGTSHFVFQARMTQKGYLLLMCKEFTLMYPAALPEASQLLDEIFPKLHGKKANRLCVVLSKLNRFGGYLAADDEHQCYYGFDEEEEILITSMEAITNEQQKKPGNLTIQDFDITT